MTHQYIYPAPRQNRWTESHRDRALLPRRVSTRMALIYVVNHSTMETVTVK
jgi:hypothetical protein